MRIISGAGKGLRLKSPHRMATRPTTDLVRGALFSILTSLGARYDRVLDLFAGTGALGIEALSRGAVSVDFVEQNHRACGLIRDNLAQTGLSDASHVYCSTANKALQFLPGPYDLIVMDPPYAVTEQQMANLSPGGLLSPGGVLVILHSSRITLEIPDNRLRLIKQRKYGDTSLSILQKECIA
ncbi:MAG: 16S rRNA (guanine(966)-N(2))-methyltransferase RsmD [Chloroflexi bacterium]|nr:16S rRNA (guanine(966)-N(2))-methyltransferase RsmD [Chloroflexota bacterium]